MTQIDLSGYTDRILVDMTTRKIRDDDTRACIQYDHKAIRKIFEIDRYLDGVDLAGKHATIHWSCGADAGIYPVTEWDTETAEGKILIKWELLAEYTQGAVLTYAIHFYDLDGEEYGYRACTRIVRTVLPPTLVMTDHSNKTEDPSAVEQLAGKLEEVEKSIVQSDYDQNDPTSMNYIKNRPFYEDVVFQCELTPDMDVSQMDTVKIDDSLSFVRVSDFVIPEGVYAIKTVVTTINGEEQSEIEDHDESVEYDENGYDEIAGYFVLANRDTEVEGLSFKKGVYVITPSLLMPEESGLVKLVCIVEILKEIDKAFIQYVYDDTDFLLGKKADRENPHCTGSFRMNTSKATGKCSFAENYGNTASGEYSHAEGSETTASGKYSHAEGGPGVIASADGSHAEGSETTAGGKYSHAEGFKTTANGFSVHSEGYETFAIGIANHVEGRGVRLDKSVYDCVHAQGKYNVVVNARGNLAHVVGNGTGNRTRSNAHTLDWDGNAWYAGDVYTGSASGKDQDGGSKKLATEEYVDSKAVQADYNQNDSTANDHIKNKPFYTADEAITYQRQVDLTSASKTIVTNEITLVEGNTYQVTWDDTSYDCVCQSMYGIRYIGNFSLVTEVPFTKPVTEEPFCILLVNDATGQIWGTKGSTHTLTMSYSTNVVHQLDPKYIGARSADEYSDYNNTTSTAGYGKVYYQSTDNDHYELILPEMPSVLETVKKVRYPVAVTNALQCDVLDVGAKTDPVNVTVPSMKNGDQAYIHVFLHDSNIATTVWLTTAGSTHMSGLFTDPNDETSLYCVRVTKGTTSTAYIIRLI